MSDLRNSSAPDALDPSVARRMRSEWNARAKEDAHYYVAFGRRDQADEEFFASAKDLVGELAHELKRLPQTVPPNPTRALEIGCGPGRLLRPMSRYFDQIYGVDVSDEMIARAKEKLQDIPHAFLHAIGGSDLRMFPAQYFDFVYSYAVFQHIPSAEVVFSYLRETVRVLRPGGIARLQFGLPQSRGPATTWNGVRVAADEIRAFTREHDMELMALTGIDSQYLWTTWRKPAENAPAATLTAQSHSRVRPPASAFSSERAVPASGWMACVAAYVENLPAGCDLNSLTAFFDGVEGRICHIGPGGWRGLSQINVFLPKGVRTGLVPLRFEWQGDRLGEEQIVRVIRPGPAVPRLTALSDSVNRGTKKIESKLVKVLLEEVDDISGFRASVEGTEVISMETFHADPLTGRWEVNFEIPSSVEPGERTVRIHLGERVLGTAAIEVIP
jgi:SAM-dependent methyltransferase